MFVSVGIIAVLVIIASSFLVSIPVTQAVTYPTTTVVTAPEAIVVVNVNRLTEYIPGLSTSSSVSTYQTSSLTIATVSGQSATSEEVFNVGPTMLKPNHYVATSATLQPASIVTVGWATDNPASVYLFNSSEYAAYSKNADASSNVASHPNTGSGTLSIAIPSQDTYYFVIENPNAGVIGLGAKNDHVNSSGTVSYNLETTTDITQTNTYLATTTLYSTITTTATSTTSIPETSTTSTTNYSTETGNATSMTSCSYNFWQWVMGKSNCQ
jgi:hypothetical protein